MSAGKGMSSAAKEVDDSGASDSPKGDGGAALWLPARGAASTGAATLEPDGPALGALPCALACAFACAAACASSWALASALATRCSLALSFADARRDRAPR